MKSTTENNISTYQHYGVVIYDDINSLFNHEKDQHPFHDIWAFLIVKQGSINLSINEYEITVSKNDLLFYSHNHYINKVEVSEDFSGTVMIINALLASELIQSNVEMMKNLFYVGKNPIIHLPPEIMEQCLRYFGLIRFKCGKNNSNTIYIRDIIHSIARAALYEWASIVNSNIPKDSQTHELCQADRLFKKFIYELTNSKVKSRSVNYYAQELCVTPKYLSCVCKKVTGKTASAYINFYVSKDIKQLLKYSDKSIKDIALKLGFSNLSFFGKYVKTHLGMSPSEFRKKRP